jgi:hypothetical protein
MFNLPVDIVRHIFKLFLDDNPLEIFHLEKEIFEICEYTKDEISSLIKKSIIKNYENKKIPLFDFENEHIFETLLFLENINLLYSIDINYILPKEDDFEYDYIFLKKENLINFEMFKFVYENYSDEWKNIALLEICIHDNLEFLKWFLYRNPICNFRYSILYFCIKNNNLEMVEILNSKNKDFSLDKDYCRVASRFNRLEILKYFLSQNPPYEWDKWECYYATNDSKIRKFINNF